MVHLVYKEIDIDNLSPFPLSLFIVSDVVNNPVSFLHIICQTSSELNGIGLD